MNASGGFRAAALTGTACLFRRQALLDAQWLFGRRRDASCPAEDARLARDLENAGRRVSAPRSCSRRGSL